MTMDDNNIYFLGGAPKKRPRGDKRHRWLVWLVVSIVVLFLLSTILFMPESSDGECDSEPLIDADASYATGEYDSRSIKSTALSEWIEKSAVVDSPAVTALDTIVNDIPLHVFYPQNMVPRLTIGYDVTLDTVNNLMFMQAADVRADNKKILGAFVLKGVPLSWGLSKKGYCAIIDGEVTVGVADDSPLFEEATEKEGYFFRQYALVDSFQMVENQLKNKAVRRAICDVDGEVVVVETLSRESMHDFAEALTDMGVCNAVNLVGSSSIGWVRSDKSYVSGHHDQHRYKNASFIVWSK